MKNNQNKKAYTILVVILIIGFLMVLTIGILKLVMDEMKDNTSLGNYQKAYIAAEAAQELALLQIKEKGYGYNEPLTTNFSKNILSPDLSNIELKDAVIDYTNDGADSEFEGIIEPLQNHIMPMFTLKNDPSDVTKAVLDQKLIDQISLSIESGNGDQLSWNILSENSGIAGNNIFNDNTPGKKKGIDETTLQLNYDDNVLVKTFLSNNIDNSNYLMLFNSDENNPITYKFNSDSSEFTKPELTINSTAQVGDYKQNIDTKINYANIVNRAKYSIYSN